MMIDYLVGCCHLRDLGAIEKEMVIMTIVCLVLLVNHVVDILTML